jgi:very-short-patch-repair endonuclease
MNRIEEDGIAKLVDRQHGVVTRGQLIDAGLGPGCIGGRVRRRRLLPVQRGVYRVGPLSPQVRIMAAVLTCPGAVASHGSAGFLWDLAPHPGEAHITAARAGANRPGIRRHRSELEADEVTTLHGIPLTTPARTLLDLAGAVGERELERALAQAERREAPRSELLKLLDRHQGRRGVRILRKLLHGDRPAALTRSEAEERFLGLVTRAELERPEANISIGGFEVDFVWQRERVVVEVDGFAFHSSPASFESDRRRDAVLAAQGYLVVRVTWHQLVEEPEATVVRLAQALVLAARARGG